ncbi:hypothetical protein POM88_005459 [Heracleum sosnowskyi]|uniref:Uncharacterized protein n=1 Tax=Heracleum sosnowskyi TaxID=360622 RepID=A0AAD8N4I1_9APIA|nr:hypothetical protein POM88_005459 [Heracleum sosnowskyi]
MRPIHQKGITSHADSDFNNDRPDPDDKELVRVDKEQRRRGDKDKERREDRDRDDKDIDHDVKCSPQKRMLEEGCSFFEKVKERLHNSEQYLEIYRCLDVFNRGIISRVELDSLVRLLMFLHHYLYGNVAVILSGTVKRMLIHNTVFSKSIVAGE